jgi:DNA-directed RNA polymerase subunit RPC12/RpoP
MDVVQERALEALGILASETTSITERLARSVVTLVGLTPVDFDDPELTEEWISLIREANTRAVETGADNARATIGEWSSQRASAYMMRLAAFCERVIPQDAEPDPKVLMPHRVLSGTRVPRKYPYLMTKCPDCGKEVHTELPVSAPPKLNVTEEESNIACDACGSRFVLDATFDAYIYERSGKKAPIKVSFT